MPNVKSKDVEEAQFLLSQMMRSLRDHPPGKMVARNISFAQMRVLWLLSSRTGATMGEIAEMLGVTRPSATSVVDRLASGGYVRRERDESDRRTVRLRLLPKGAATLAARRRHMAEQISRILQVLEEPERRNLIAALRLVSTTIQTASAKSKERRT